MAKHPHADEAQQIIGVPPPIPSDGIGRNVYFVPQGEQLYPNQPPSLIRFNLIRNIINYDSDNNLPGRLAMMYELSPTLGGVLNRLANYVHGEGLAIVCDDPSQKAKAEKWADNWGNQMGASEIFRRHALDYMIYGGFCMELAWYQAQELASCFYTPWAFCRIGFDPQTQKDGKQQRVLYISPDWQHYEATNWQFKPEIGLLYDGQPSEENSYLYHRRYTPGFDYYPLPLWFAAYSSAVLEFELIKFMTAHAVNAFAPGGIFTMAGASDKTVIEQMERQVNSNRGTAASGRIMVVAGTEEDRVNFTPFNDNPLDKDVSAFYEQARQNIITACGVPSPTLIGLPGGASLGGDGGTMQSAHHILRTSVIAPIQREILAHYNHCLKQAGYEDCRFEVVEPPMPTDATNAAA